MALLTGVIHVASGITVTASCPFCSFVSIYFPNQPMTRGFSVDGSSTNPGLFIHYVSYEIGLLGSIAGNNYLLLTCAGMGGPDSCAQRQCGESELLL